MPELCGVFATMRLKEGGELVLQADLCTTCADDLVTTLKERGLTERADR